MPKYSLTILCEIGVSFANNNHFFQGVNENDTSPILPYVKNWYNYHFIYKIVRDVKNLIMETIVFVMLVCGIIVSFAIITIFIRG